MMPTVISDVATPALSRASESLIRAAFVGTALFIVTASTAVFVKPVRVVAMVVAGTLFFAGIAAFFAAYFRAVARSRDVVLGVGGIYFLSGSAPRAVQVKLLGAVAVQSAVGLATASLRPYTSLAFGMLVPMFGVGITGLWGALYGRYPERPGPSASLADDD